MPKVNYKSDNALTDDFKRECVERQKKSKRCYRCAWGTCNSDSQYYNKREELNNVYFIGFPKPKTEKEKCLIWIKACNRPHDQLNVDKINREKYVCS